MKLLLLVRRGNSSDIYIFDIETKLERKITNDIFTDSYPSWNSEGNEIVFVSDRGQFTDGEYNGLMSDHNYKQTDIYTVNTLNGL